MIDISAYFLSLVAVAGLDTILTGWVTTQTPLKNANRTWKQVISWVIAILLAFVGQAKMLGIFADTNILYTILNGVGVGLIANGIFDVTIVQSILSFIGAAKKPA